MRTTEMATLLAFESEDVKPGWVALLIVFALGVALAFLMLSLSHQLKKVKFDEDDPEINPPKG